jgi:hypothetical protein
MATSLYDSDVFINCPFDSRFQELFNAIVFAVFDCGFRPRCSLELDDGSQVRIDKIFDLIRDCKLGMHDISRTEAEEGSGFPRFNMPLELGMFLGAKRFGQGVHKQKVCLILDREKFRYQSFISDISGQDIRPHEGKPSLAIEVVRDWLRGARPDVSIPGGTVIGDRYATFLVQLPTLCERLRLAPGRLTFLDFKWCISSWLQVNSWDFDPERV